jgi:hypothetical protein
VLRVLGRAHMADTRTISGRRRSMPIAAQSANIGRHWSGRAGGASQANQRWRWYRAQACAAAVA